MPTSPLMQIPKSRSPEEFECLCSDILSNIYATRFVGYGRNGQSQSGIDIYAQPHKDNYIVAQCKNYFSANSANKLVKQIENDVEAAKKISFNINIFVAMTAMDRDRNVQDSITHINSSFKIELWFWEEIQEKVCSDNLMLHKYYPSFFANSKLPIMTLNEIISNLNILKSVAQDFNDNYQGYRVAYHQQNDILLYNKCVTMVNAYIEIGRLKDQWYLQLKNIGVIDTIEKIIKSAPDFHDASEDWTGATMIYTLTNYLNHFCSDNITAKFAKNCDEIMKCLSSEY